MIPMDARIMRNLKAAFGRMDDAELEEFLNSPTEIRLEDVSFAYPDGTSVLDGITLTIDEPGLYCIIGPNGVGKSTLVKCISKIHPATSGEVYINGRGISGLSHREVSQVIGYVPVVSQDVFSMSVLETILVGCHNRRCLDTDESKMKAVYKAMVLMQIEDLSSRLFNELSAGQHQKVAIARGIVQRPKVLILDEPTANLDVKYQVYVTELLRALAEHERIIVLTISHDLNISAKYAHRVIMMESPGVIYKVGSSAEVITAENIERVYGVRCRIIPDEQSDSPIVVLGQTVLNEQGRFD